MRLRDVLAGCRVVQSSGDLECDVFGIAYDSRQVSRGFVFAAIRGLRTDGNQFALQAIASGAAAVVSVSPPPAGVKAAWIQVEDDRESLATLASNFFDRPTTKLHAIGITGTNGKTTTTYLVESILKAAGHPAAVFGTVEYRGPGFEYKAERTTPEAPELESLFRKVVDGGWNYAVMEVSSHAVDLKRVERLHFDVAVFTNLSRDHLDYHKDMRSYFLAKKRLFAGLDGKVPRVMVLNKDDSQFAELSAIAPSHVISYGIETVSDVRPSSFKLGWSGIDATIPESFRRLRHPFRPDGKAQSVQHLCCNRSRIWPWAFHRLHPCRYRAVARGSGTIRKHSRQRRRFEWLSTTPIRTTLLKKFSRRHAKSRQAE